MKINVAQQHQSSIPTEISTNVRYQLTGIGTTLTDHYTQTTVTSNQPIQKVLNKEHSHVVILPPTGLP